MGDQNGPHKSQRKRPGPTDLKAGLLSGRVTLNVSPAVHQNFGSLCLKWGLSQSATFTRLIEQRNTLSSLDLLMETIAELKKKREDDHVLLNYVMELHCRTLEFLGIVISGQGLADTLQSEQFAEQGQSLRAMAETYSRLQVNATTGNAIERMVVERRLAEASDGSPKDARS